jgi:perosamine synthetase
MIKPISISLSPNTEADDVWLAFRLLFQPWKWGSGKAISGLEQEFGGVSFNSGRSAFMAILEGLELEKGDEVLLQAFTCNAVPNPVIWSGFKPVYVDCNEEYNIDAEDLEKKVSLKSKVVVVQHTFGIAADMDRIMEVCKRHNLILIEDCAHALGATYKGNKVGTFGKAAFFSFSRDKVISSVYGGMAVTNDRGLEQKLRAFQERAGYPATFWVFQQLLHPVLMNIVILPTYSIIGKYALVALQKLSVLSMAVHRKEKQAEQPGYFPKRMPNALAILAVYQLKKLDRFNAHRREIARIYGPVKEGIYLRYPVQSERAHDIIKKAWKKNILIGDWYTSPLAPAGTNLKAMQYKMGSCPNAERLAKTTYNLPTHIRVSKKQAQQLKELCK